MKINRDFLGVGIAVLIVLVILFLLIRGCPALFSPKERVYEGIPTNETISRSQLMADFDFDCLVFYCMQDCTKFGEESNETCQRICSSGESLERNCQKYSTCRRS